MRIKQSQHTGVQNHQFVYVDQCGQDDEIGDDNSGNADYMTVMDIGQWHHQLAKADVKVIMVFENSERMLPWLLEREEVKVLHLVRDPRCVISKSVFVFVNLCICMQICICIWCGIQGVFFVLFPNQYLYFFPDPRHDICIYVQNL